MIYTDNLGVKASTIDTLDLRVVGPNGYKKTPYRVSLDSPSNGKTRKATYQITPPDGSAWTAADSGLYTVMLQRKQITDLTGTPVAAGKVGTFSVDILPSTSALTALGEVSKDYLFGLLGANDTALAREAAQLLCPLDQPTRSGKRS